MEWVEGGGEWCARGVCAVKIISSVGKFKNQKKKKRKKEKKRGLIHLDPSINAKEDEAIEQKKIA